MDELINTIRRELRITVPIQPDTPLLSSGIVDSFAVARLLTTLETHYGIALDPAELGVDNFDTARQMLEQVQAKT
jgi:acyl carrier protein